MIRLAVAGLFAVLAGHGQAGNPESACVQALASRAELAAVSDKVWLGGARHQPFDFMARQDWADTGDLRVLSQWLRARHDCFLQGQAWRERHASTAEFALAELVYARFLDLSAQLYMGELSYGQYSQARAELSMEALRSLAGFIHLRNE